MERKIFTLNADNLDEFEDIELIVESRYRLGIAEYVKSEILDYPEKSNEEIVAKGLEYDEPTDSFYIPKGAKITYNGVVGATDNFIVENNNQILDLYYNLKRSMEVSSNQESFTFEITETLQRQVVVIAANKNDARKIVEKRYKNSEIVLDADDFVGYEIEEV